MLYIEAFGCLKGRTIQFAIGYLHIAQALSPSGIFLHLSLFGIDILSCTYRLQGLWRRRIFLGNLLEKSQRLLIFILVIKHKSFSEHSSHCIGSILILSFQGIIHLWSLFRFSLIYICVGQFIERVLSEIGLGIILDKSRKCFYFLRHSIHYTIADGLLECCIISIGRFSGDYLVIRLHSRPILPCGKVAIS